MGSWMSRRQLPAYDAASAPPKRSCKPRHQPPAYDAASAPPKCSGKPRHQPPSDVAVFEPPVERPPETPTTFTSIRIGARSVLHISSQDGDFIGAYEGEGCNTHFRIMSIAPSVPK